MSEIRQYWKRAYARHTAAHLRMPTVYLRTPSGAAMVLFLNVPIPRGAVRYVYIFKIFERITANEGWSLDLGFVAYIRYADFIHPGTKVINPVLQIQFSPLRYFWGCIYVLLDSDISISGEVIRPVNFRFFAEGCDIRVNYTLYVLRPEVISSGREAHRKSGHLESFSSGV